MSLHLDLTIEKGKDTNEELDINYVMNNEGIYDVNGADEFKVITIDKNNNKFINLLIKDEYFIDVLIKSNWKDYTFSKSKDKITMVFENDADY